MTLTLDYRPRRFSDIVSQKPTRAVLMQMVLKGNAPPALLFEGPRGTGKTTTGRIFASALNCTERQPGSPEPCLTCVSCKSIINGSSIDVVEVDAASNGLVADVRELREALMYEVGGNYRVVLLDEVHSMSREAFNALLKTLEEPPPRTIFVLLTTDPGRVIETVLSRCMRFEFRRVVPTDIAARLRYIADQENITIQDELLMAIAERSRGAMRDAVMSLDQCQMVGVQTVDQYQLLTGDVDYAPKVFDALLRSDLPSAYDVLDDAMSRTGDAQQVASDLTHLLRELLVLSAGGTIHRAGEQLQLRAELASRCQADRLLAVARTLWDFKTRIRVSEDMRVVLELMVVVCYDTLQGQARHPSAQIKEPPKTMGLSDLKTIAMKS